MSIAPPLGVDPESFTSGGLDALLSATAQETPDVVVVGDDDGMSTAGDLARRMRRLSARLVDAGLMPGERVLILVGAQTNALVALAAALHARLEPVLSQCGTGPVEIAAQVRAAKAVALVGPSAYGERPLGEAYLSAAALTDEVRLVATQGPHPVDGALDVSFATLDAADEPCDDAVAGQRRDPSLIGTFEGPSGAPRLVLHRQAALLADALLLVEQARIIPSKRMIVTLPPSTLAGLVAGPFAALIGASSLVWHGPFAARGFLAVCDQEPGAHVVAPAAIGALFRESSLVDKLGSLILVSRFRDPAGFALPDALVCERPIVDVYAFGEDTVLAQRRVDGTPRPPSRVTDKSLSGGLGARLNRARADAIVHDPGSA